MKTTLTKRLVVVTSILLLTQSVVAFYNPSTGRWLSRDPIQEDGGQNLYGLTHNAPIAAIDRFGLAPIEGYTLQADPSDSDNPSHFAFYRPAFLLSVTYPKDGVKCACQGRSLGFIHGTAWIDLSTSFGLRDRQPDYYNKVISPWPHWIPAYKRIFENPRYVGAGFTAIWNQNNAGQICCRNPVWYNSIVRSGWPDKDDGRFPGIQFVDSPGGLRPPLRSFSRAYKLVLKCEDPGWPAEVIGQWAWGVDIQLDPWLWTGTFYPPTPDFAEPWPF